MINVYFLDCEQQYKVNFVHDYTYFQSFNSLLTFALWYFFRLKKYLKAFPATKLIKIIFIKEV